jgi:putative ABC transport system permease protein
MLQDLKFAVRGLVRSPRFAGAALITLALGIGATSAIFSVVKAVVLTPLPYPEADRRVMIWSRWISFDKTWLSAQEVVDFRTLASTLDDVCAWSTGQFAAQNLTGDGDPLRVAAGYVTANTFEVLGVPPLLGRAFTAEEDRPNGPPAVILGYELWQARYNGDPQVIGRTLMLDDVPVEVVGVMPRAFRLPTDFTVDAADPTQVWRPLQMDLENLARGSHSYFAAAILAPGATAASATAELQAITQRLTEEGEYPREMQFSAFAVTLDEDIRGGIRPAMVLLMGGVSFLLLIACVNVANLLLVRGDAQLRELAVRTAIGAAPRRVVRQLIVEAFVLALAGAVAGLLLAAGALRIFVALDAGSLVSMAPVSLDLAVLGFTLILAVVTTIISGVAPAFRALRVNLVESLREGGHQATIGGHRQRTRHLLVVTEVALAVILVIGGGLMIRSLAALGRIDLGFDPARVLTMRVAIPQTRYDTPERVEGFYRQLVDRVRAVNGVEHAGIVRVLPLATTIGDWGLDVQGFEEAPGRNAKGDWQVVSDGAFEAMGSRLVRGRWFTPDDHSGAQPVAVINETMARTYWVDGEAVGGRIRLGSPRNPWVTVVGIVADERHNGMTGVVKEKFYIPHGQWPIVTGGNVIRNVFVVARTTGDPLAVAGAIREAVRATDANVPVANIRMMNDVVAASMSTPRLTGFLLAAFGGVALALAAVGIYGLLSYLVSQRRQEIGIRLAVGAGRGQVLRMILRQGLTLAIAGVAAGVAAAFALTRWMESLLYEVRPTDPVTFATVPLVLVGVAILASLLPGWRATRVSPVQALRAE